MAATSASNRTAHLSQPNGTADIEGRFVSGVKQRALGVRGLVRRTIGYENDALGLKQDAQLAEERENFPQRSAGPLARAFTQWFREVLRDELLEPLPLSQVAAGEHWTAEYIRPAYLQAWQQAAGRLQQQGVSTGVMDVDAIVQLPVPKRQLRQLYRRAYGNLKGITDDMAQTIREELTRGLAAGENPRTMVTRLNSEIESFTNTRLQVLARTEVAHSHATATLDRYERSGADTVQHGEWADADDGRVCPICSFLDGNEYTVSEFRTGTFTFEPSEGEPDYLAGNYPLAPPAHPQCRCTILPVVS